MFHSLREVSAREFDAHGSALNIQLGSLVLSALPFSLARSRDPISASSENGHSRSKATNDRRDTPFQILIARDSRHSNNNDARDAADSIALDDANKNTEELIHLIV